MVGAQDPHLVGSSSRNSRSGFGVITALPGECRDVAPGGQGVGVVGAQTRTRSGISSRNSRSGLGGITSCPMKLAMLPRVARV